MKFAHWRQKLVARRIAGSALLTLQFLRLFDFLESLLDICEVMDVERSLKSPHPSGREGGGTTTLGTRNGGLSSLVSRDHFFDASSTVDMEALE